jgi:MSHA biogenesis protein MshG
MPTFEFMGRDAQGKKVEGKRTSQSSDNLSLQLIHEGIYPTKIISRESKFHFTKLNWMKWFQRKIKMEELAWFARQMHTLTKTGVPITLALKQIADNAHSEQMAEALNGLIEGLHSGKDLASAMQLYPMIFTPIMINMVRVGQNSGRLDEAFLRLNDYFSMESSTLKRAKTALRYPTFIFIAIISAVFIVNIYVIPTFSKTFAESGIALPLVTKILVGFSNFLTANGLYLLLILMVSLATFFFYLHKPSGRLFFDKTLLKIPVIGKILRYIVLLRFTQSFSIVIEAGLSLTEGINLVADALHNRFAREEILSLSHEIKRGKSLTQAALDNALLSPLEVQLFAVSEQTGELAAMLRQVAEFYQREIDYDLKRLTDLVEPVLILSLSALIMVLAFAVYLPIWNMVRLVHT